MHNSPQPFLMKHLLNISLAVCLTLLLLPGCISKNDREISKYEKDGIQYGVTRGNFRGRWWNYYERGRSFADGEFWNEAETDLRHAIRIRGIDDRRSRTYGMHYIQYFGNRELGVILFHQQRYEEAVPLLERSLGQEPSEKALYYLDRCRKELVESDTEPPELHMDALPDMINSSLVLVAGFATDNTFVERVTVNGYSVPTSNMGRSTQFEHRIQLSEGEWQLEVTAEDIKGNVAIFRHNVIVDLTAPFISILESDARRVVLEVHDDHPVEVKRYENLEPISHGDGRYEFRFLRSAGRSLVEFRDRAGNTNGVSLERAQKRAESKGRRIELVSADVLPGMIPPRSIDDSQKLALKGEILLDHLSDQIKVFQDHILVEGLIAGEFTDLTIDDIPRLNRGRDTRFSFRKNLAVGRNAMKIEATDNLNGRMKKDIIIDRYPDPIDDRRFRAKAVLHPLATENGDDQEGYKPYHGILSHAIFERARFNLLERERLDAIMAEFQIIEDGWIKSDRAARTGRLLDADYSIACTVRAAVNDIEIFGRVIDNATSTVLAECDVYDIIDRPDGYDNAFKRFAKKLDLAFPIVEAEIAERGRSHLVIDLGRNANIAPGMRFNAYHRDAPMRNSITGAVILKGRIVIDGEYVAADVKSRATSLKPLNGTVSPYSKVVVAK